jgi:hypothetical protein
MLSQYAGGSQRFKEYTTFILRGPTYYPVIQYNTPQEQNAQLHCCENLKTPIIASNLALNNYGKL